MNDNNAPKIAFFGTPAIAVASLAALHAARLTPSLVVTNPNRPSGRNGASTPPPAKEWALAHGIPVLQPSTLRDGSFMAALRGQEWDLFVVVAYGALIPPEILVIPKHGVLNMHPSLLPKFRGPTPIRSAILADARETGVSVMLMDEQLDHGPVVAQEPFATNESEWPVRGRELDRVLAERGGALLAKTVSKWIEGAVAPQEQDHAAATYTKKLTKDMGELALDPHRLPYGAEAYDALLKIRAFDGWPGTYFFHDGKRIKIVDAEIDHDGTLRILRIVPEGKREMEFDSYFRN